MEHTLFYDNTQIMCKKSIVDRVVIVVSKEVFINLLKDRAMVQNQAVLIYTYSKTKLASVL